MTKSSILVFIIRIFLGFLFCYSGIIKLMDTASFSKTIITFGIIPENLAIIVAILISVVELLLGGFLVVGLYIKPTALALSVLIFVFIIILFNALISGTASECGCFGGGEKLDVWSIVKDAVLLGMSLIIMQTKSHWLALENLYLLKQVKQY